MCAICPQRRSVSESDFEPEYEEAERGAGIIGRLKSAVKSAEEVYALPPTLTAKARLSRPALWQCLKLKNYKRITFAEITESAVKAAIAAPRQNRHGPGGCRKARRGPLTGLTVG